MGHGDQEQARGGRNVRGDPCPGPLRAVRGHCSSSSIAVMAVVAATDGSCLGNPGPGGWAWVTEDGREGSGAVLHTTNNRMELRAVLELLRALDKSEPVVIQTDSAYVIGVFTRWLEGWRRKGMRTSRNAPVENRDLIEAIAHELDGRQVRFEKVPGH